MYTKPKVTIDLEEYQDLQKRKTVENTNVTDEELLVAVTQLVGIAIQEPNMIRRPPADGILLNTPVGKFNVKLAYVQVGPFESKVQSFQITKLE